MFHGPKMLNLLPSRKNELLNKKIPENQLKIECRELPMLAVQGIFTKYRFLERIEIEIILLEIFCTIFLVVFSEAHTPFF